MKMRGRRYFGLLMAMRTGKTKVTIDDYGEMELAGEVQDLLVTAPAGAYRTWQEELGKHASADLLDRMRLLTWESGRASQVGFKSEVKAFMSIRDRRRPRVLLVNIEAISSVAKCRDLVTEFVAQRRAEVAADESTTIKNIDAGCTIFMTDIIKPLSSYRRILSGLPAPKNPLDLYGQFNFLDKNILGVTNFAHFRNRYAVVHQMPTMIGGKIPIKIPIVVAFKNLPLLYESIQPHSYRIKLEDIVDLPVTYGRRDVSMTDEQQKAYRELKKYAVTMLEGGGLITAQMVITQMLRLHQILMGYVMDSDGVLRELKESRTAALLELLEEYDGKKAIIWCSYDYSVRKVAAALAKRYGEKAVARFWGGNASTREEDDKRFRFDDECVYMVATAASGGRGRRWHVADLVVYYSSTNNLEHRDQSEERAKDMEKERMTYYVDLLVRGTVDEKFIYALREKMNLHQIVTGDNYKEWLV
jgi:hypothetical protein